jgi:ferritin
MTQRNRNSQHREKREKSILATKIAAPERTVQDKSEQLARLEQQVEKAYSQVQEIAVRAIEGSASAKQLAHLQQLFAEQLRKGNPPER